MLLLLSLCVTNATTDDQAISGRKRATDGEKSSRNIKQSGFYMCECILKCKYGAFDNNSTEHFYGPKIYELAYLHADAMKLNNICVRLRVLRTNYIFKTINYTM